MNKKYLKNPKVKENLQNIVRITISCLVLTSLRTSGQ